MTLTDPLYFGGSVIGQRLKGVVAGHMGVGTVANWDLVLALWEVSEWERFCSIEIDQYLANQTSQRKTSYTGRLP